MEQTEGSVQYFAVRIQRKSTNTHLRTHPSCWTRTVMVFNDPKSQFVGGMSITELEMTVGEDV